MALTVSVPQARPAVEDRRTPSILIKNKVVGTVIACHRSQPQRMRYRARMAGGSTITFLYRTLSVRPDSLDIGQQVTLDIPPHDVILSPPRWVSPLENNCWPARVVLSARHDLNSLLVVKILGSPWTLTSTRQAFWLNRPLHAWDRVTVYIAPESCSVVRRYPGDLRLRPRLLTEVLSNPAAAPPAKGPARRPPYQAHRGREPSLLGSLPLLNGSSLHVRLRSHGLSFFHAGSKEEYVLIRRRFRYHAAVLVVMSLLMMWCSTAPPLFALPITD
ncbi:MAG: hypothetical protein OJF52_000972 [Nitrospira sp.]|jgi:hypothetical protein|nr:MAG: hypothetical protein OJF52_000972 [Nitrospira sp.]